MSTVAVVRQAVIDYLNVGFPTETSGSAASLDALILLALNNARKFAEQRHNFRKASVTVYGTTTNGRLDYQNGLSDFDEVIVGNVKIRDIQTIYIQENEGPLVPVLFKPRRTLVADRIEEGLVHQYTTVDEYRDYNVYTGSPNMMFVTTWGEKLIVEPTPVNQVKLVLDAFRKMPDYVDNDSTDFFLEDYTSYMLWASLCEANHLVKQFVVRQEGGLPPPTKERDEALENAIIDDQYFGEGRYTKLN